MQVAIVCPYDLGRYGGVQDQTMRLASWLRDAGHHAWVVGPGRGPDGTVSVGPATVVPANGAATPIALGPGAPRRVAAAVRDADLVHVHEPLMPLVSLSASLRGAVPTVGTFHADAPRAVRYGYRRLFGLTGGRVGKLDVVTAVSPVAAAPLVNVVRHRLVPNGLDVDAFPHASPVSGRVAFVGRDDPRKGLDVFVGAAETVAASHPGASFMVAGTGERGRRGVVEFVGRPTDEGKRELLASAEIFVAPHRGGESFGIVIAEAMAAGCAVVASALPSFAHVLGDAGVLVPPGDGASVAAAVCELLADDERRAAFQAAARRRVLRFDRSVVLNGYLGAYHDAFAR
ncbi:MAG: glycosyltransferase family 4 protein [Acidimicrobiia bacterium]